MLLNSKFSRVIIAPMDKSQTLYEVAYLISPAYSEEEARSFHQSIKDGAQNAGGLIEHDGDVTKKRLAYPVKKMTEAYLASFLMLLDSDKLATLKSALASKEVLRYMLSHGKRQPARLPYKPRLKPSQDVILKTSEDLQPASNIAEIDKKLEEILGK